MSWLAVERGEAGAVLEALGLQEIGASNEPGEAAYAYTVTTAGWLVLVAALKKDVLAPLPPVLSAQAQVLAGEVSDVVMVSRVQAWRSGAPFWSVTHDAEQGVEHLETTGEPPGELAEIHAKLSARQAEDDEVDHLFDAPLELAQRICGFKPDEPLPGPWILLARPKREAGPRASSLPAAIRTEVVPTLAELGWTIAPVRVEASGRTYDASRIRDGRLEALRFLWRDDRRDLEIIPSYAVVEGDRPDGRLLIGGAIYANPPTIWRRIRALGWAKAGQPKTYEEKVGAAVERARRELLTIDAFFRDDAPRLFR